MILGLMFTACEKDDPIVPDPDEITVSDLVGDWRFVSLEFNGEIYTDCDFELNKDYGYVTLNFFNMTTTEVMLYTDCVDGGADPDDRIYPYTLSNNTINCSNESRVFEILNVEAFDGTELVLELKSAKTTGIPITGIYTLIKE